jgi:hypothetical protein
MEAFSSTHHSGHEKKLSEQGVKGLGTIIIFAENSRTDPEIQPSGRTKSTA